MPFFGTKREASLASLQIAQNIETNIHVSTIASESNDVPLRRLKICFQKENIHGSPLVSRRVRGKGDLKQQFVQTSFSAANRSPLDGQRICQRVCLHLSTYLKLFLISLFRCSMHVEMTIGSQQQAPSFCLTLLLGSRPLGQVAARLGQA